MFPLHDRTRRRICLIAFGLLCLLPTAGVLAWCAAWRLPGHVRGEARRLARLSGMTVALAGLHHPRPGRIVYRELELANPETGRRVLHCDRLEAAWNVQNHAEGREKTLLALKASSTEIDAAEWGEVRRLFERVLARRAGPGAVDIRLSCEQIVLRDGEKNRMLDEIRATLKTTETASVAEWSFRPSGSEATDPIRARIRRETTAEDVSNEFELYTGREALSGDVLSRGLGIEEPFDSRCQFRGYLRARHTEAGWDGELFGTFEALELDRLVSDHFSHRLSGRANLTLRRVRFSAGRIEEAEGSLVAGPGMVSRSLLEAAMEHLGLVRGWERPESQRLVPYEQLAASFMLDARGLQLRGACGQGEPGTLLLNRRGSLAAEPRQIQSIASLLTTLAPRARYHLPITRETEWLARHLPLTGASKPTSPLIGLEAPPTTEPIRR